jgi:predicted nucleotidyltransferase
MLNRTETRNMEPILSKREIEVVRKRLNNEHITQTESNYMSRSIRPKLRSAEFLVATKMLSLLDYRRKRYEREDNVLKDKLVEGIEKCIEADLVKAIVLFGSYVRNNHSNYRDIDVMVVLKRKLWKTSAEKNKIKRHIESLIDVKLDITLVVYNELVKILPYSPLLQSELEYSKIIYGGIRLEEKKVVDKKYLYKKLLEVEYVLELKKINSKYIYNAIRSCLSIRLFIDKKVSNKLVIKTIEDNIGRITSEALIENKVNKVQREIGTRYLKYLYEELSETLK